MKRVQPVLRNSILARTKTSPADFRWPQFLSWVFSQHKNGTSSDRLWFIKMYQENTKTESLNLKCTKNH